MFWILPVDFHLTLVAQILCAKLIFVLEVWGLRESGIGIFLFVEHPISSVFNMQSVHVNVDFTLSLVTQTIRVKRFFFSQFSSVLQRSNDVNRAPWKMVWILLVNFDLSLFTRVPYVEHINCENSRSVSKEASKLLLSLNTLSIISPKWPISWIFFDWPLIVITFKSTTKTHLLWKLQVLWKRRVSISIYLTKFSFLQVF